MVAREESVEFLERMEEEIREKTIEFDHDAGRQREPDGGKDRSRGQKLFHGFRKDRGREDLGGRRLSEEKR